MFLKDLSLKRIGIEKVLFFSYILVIFPVLVVGIIMSSYFVDNYKQELISSNMQFVNEFQLNMDYSIKEIIGMSLTIYSNGECIDILSKPKDRDEVDKVADFKTFNNYIQMLIYRNFMSGVYIYTYDGQYYFGNCNTGIFNIDETLNSSPWLKSIIPQNSRDFSFLATHRPNQLIGGSPVFSIVRNIKENTTGRQLGIMLIDLNPEMLGSTYKFPDGNSSRTFIVTDSKRSIIYHTDRNKMMTALSDKKYDSVFLNEKGFFTFSDSGIDYLASYSTSKLTGWKVMAVTPLESVIKKAEILRSSLIWLAVLSLLFAILFSLFFSRYISNPLKSLTAKMKSVGTGNFEVAYAPKGTKEVYLLGEGFNSMIEKIKNLLKNEFQLKLLKKDAEFKALQAQINPHFLYNTLESISVLAELEKVPGVGKTCRLLSNMFRYSISTKTDVVPIRNEVEHLQDYLSIIKLRFQDTIDFDVRIGGELYEYEIIKLVLQPLVENSINHGLSDISSKGIICVAASKDGGSINISVSDNGRGMTEEKKNSIVGTLNAINSTNIWEAWQDSSTSIGLRNIHLRLTSHYGQGYGIVSIESKPEEGTKICLSIPAIKVQRRSFNV